MTTEFVLLLAVYAFLMLGLILGPEGPIGTFNTSTPRLAALVERNISTGHSFRHQQDPDADTVWGWQKPQQP